MAVDIYNIKKESSIESVCRLCFAESDQYQLIFVDEYSTLHKWIEKLTSLKIMHLPNAPASLCLECETTLKNFESFQEMCFTNDRTIKEMFSQQDSKIEYSVLSSATPVKTEIQMDQREEHQTGIVNFMDNIQADDTAIEHPEIKIETTNSYDSDENDVDKSGESESTKDTQEVLEFNKKDELGVEEKTTKERPNFCCFCDREFSNSYRLKVHMRSHTQERPHQCNDCEKSFMTHSNLTRHMRIHSGLKPYACDMCPIKYRQSYDLVRHKKRVHSTEDTSTKTKEDEPSRGTEDIQVHLTEDTSINTIEDEPSHHTEDVQEIQNNEPLLDPEKVNSKKKQCTICNKFVYRINKHMVIHSDTRPYQCEYCSKGFNEKYKLTEHIRTHTKEKPYVCSYCGKGFTSGADLKIHVRSHTQERPFKCKECDDTFITSGHLKRHALIHSDMKPFPCDLCQAKFSRKRLLVHHRQRVHDENTAVTEERKESNCDTKEYQDLMEGSL